MDKFYELQDLKFEISRKAAFENMDCYEDSPVYEDVLECFEEIYEDMLSFVKPVGVLGVGTLPKEIASEKYPAETPVIYAVTSIGDGLKQRSNEAFQEEDYVKGVLIDCMADAALFSMEEQLVTKVQEICGELQMGVLERLEAPHSISMQAQYAAWEYLELKKRFQIDISSGYMFDPVKTSCQIFILTQDRNVFRAQHDCRKCPNKNCKMRKVMATEIFVHSKEKIEKIFIKEEKSLMEGLVEAGYYVSAICGGKGRCGKCKVQVLKGNAAISEADKKQFTEQELNEGWRLACCFYPTETMEIALRQEEEKDFEVLTAFQKKSEEFHTQEKVQSDAENPQKGVLNSKKDLKCLQNDCKNVENYEKSYDVAVDIGTTTMVVQLLDGISGKQLHAVSSINSQRRYGADVISRIQASVDGKLAELQNLVHGDIKKNLERLVQEMGISVKQVKHIAISANTTMGHLLMGYDCSTLGVYPFTPVNINLIKGTDIELLGFGEGKTEVILLPGISTYVGGDIVSGLYACGFMQSEEVSLLVDLGTNGEMALGNKEKILVTSTAAGPAFEGGNISWGTGSIPGAIAAVDMDGEKVKIQTIGNQPPTGICGTGVIETIAELVREEIVCETGAMEEAYLEEGFPIAETLEGKKIVFTSKDVREIQLAKAAIRAGIETLLLRYGIEKEEVAKVYVAGGFGYKLNMEKAIQIGMFPKEFSEKIEAVGNSSLAGAAKYLGSAKQIKKAPMGLLESEKSGEQELLEIVNVSKEIALSADKDFNEFYMDAMFFEEEL